MRQSKYVLDKIDNEIKHKGGSYVLKKYKGTGVIDFIKNRLFNLKERDPNINPPKVRAFLDKHGEDVVYNLKAHRKPIQNSVKELLNYVSFGSLKNAVNSLGYDKLFHLSLIINDKYYVEKNDVINTGYTSDKLFDGEIINIPLNGKSYTIRQMLDNTAIQMGNNYGSYNAKNNNCQVFLDSILKANGYGNNTSSTFINQDTVELFEKMPSYVEKISNIATSGAARFNRLIQGEGIKKQVSDEQIQKDDPVMELKKQALRVIKSSGKPKHAPYNMKGKKGKGFFIPLLIQMASQLLT